MDLSHLTYCYCIQQMGMKDRSLIEEINLTFIALTMMAIHHCLSGSKAGEFRVPPQIGPGGGALRQHDTRNINHVVDNPCTAVFRCLDSDFSSLSPEVQAKTMDNILSMIHRRIHWTVTDPENAQCHNDQGTIDEDFLVYVLEELIKRPNNSFHRLTSFVAATEASMQFAAVLPMCGPAIAISSQPIPCSNSNSNSNDITNITKQTSIEKLRLVVGSRMVEWATSRGGSEWCQWSDLGFPLCGILF